MHKRLFEFDSEGMLVQENIKNRIYYKPNLHSIQMVKLFEQLERERAEGFFSKKADILAVIKEILREVPAGYLFAMMVPPTESKRNFPLLIVYDERVSRNREFTLHQENLYYNPQIFFLDLQRFNEICEKYMGGKGIFLSRRILLYNESFFYQFLSRFS